MVFSSVSRLRLQAVSPAGAEPWFRFTIEFTVSAWHGKPAQIVSPA